METKEKILSLIKDIRKIPKENWDEITIDQVMRSMDSLVKEQLTQYKNTENKTPGELIEGYLKTKAYLKIVLDNGELNTCQLVGYDNYHITIKYDEDCLPVIISKAKIISISEEE